MKRKVYQDGNGSGLIMVDGLGEYVPREDYENLEKENEKLKAVIFEFYESQCTTDKHRQLIAAHGNIKALVESLTNKGE